MHSKFTSVNQIHSMWKQNYSEKNNVNQMRSMWNQNVSILTKFDIEKSNLINVKTKSLKENQCKSN